MQFIHANFLYNICKVEFNQPKTVAPSLSLPPLSLPLYFHGAPTATKEAIEDQVLSLSLSLSLLFLYDLSMISKFITYEI